MPSRPTRRSPTARLAPLTVALLAAACAMGAGEASRGAGWTGSLGLTVERQEIIDEPTRELDELSVSTGEIPSLRLEPTDPDQPTEWRAELDGLTVTCKHDSVSVTRDMLGELRTVARGEVTGEARAEVTLWFDRDDGVYYLSVDFFGPPIPIRVEHFRNGASEGAQMDDSQACSFRHDVHRPLQRDLRAVSGTDTGGEPPWRHEMRWQLQRTR